MISDTLNVLHLASFNGNIGDNANHYAFYKYFNKIKEFNFIIDELEIREFYWKQKFFDSAFVERVNNYDLLIVGGGNYFELWVDDSPTGTSIAIELDLLKEIKTPIFFNALGVDSGQGASENNLDKFKFFLDAIIERKDFVSIRNDGARKTMIDLVGEHYLNDMYHTLDAGFFIGADYPVNTYYKNKKYIAINIASDMPNVRFKKNNYNQFLETMNSFINKFLAKYKNIEIVFVPHIFRDISVINDVITILDDKIRRRNISIAPLLHGNQSFKDIMAIYNNAEFVIANRFHANICSLGMGVKTIGLVNVRQIQELYNELNSMNFVDVDHCNFDDELMALIDSPYKDSCDIELLEKKYQKFIDSVSLWLQQKY